MKKLTKKQYYEIQEELDYVIDNENVADMKLQHTINEETTLYGLNKEADQFMMSLIGCEDIFFIEASFDEILDLYK